MGGLPRLGALPALRREADAFWGCLPFFRAAAFCLLVAISSSFLPSLLRASHAPPRTVEVVDPRTEEEKRPPFGRLKRGIRQAENLSEHDLQVPDRPICR